MTAGALGVTVVGGAGVTTLRVVLAIVLEVLVVGYVLLAARLLRR